MKYTVYLRTNKENGKQYVGQTSNFDTREKSWKCMKARYANKILQDDREKYGLESFDVKILAEVDTIEEAWELEKYYIKELRTKFPRGYNRSDGGKTNKGGTVGYHNGKEFEKGHKPWNKGVKGMHLSPESEFKGIPVVQLKDGVLITIWDSIKNAAEEINGCYTGSISRCCKGKTKTAGGFGWMYKSDYEKMLAEQPC